MNNQINYKTISIVLGILLAVSLVYGFSGLGYGRYGMYSRNNDSLQSGMHIMHGGMMMNDDEMVGDMDHMMDGMSARLVGKTGDALDKTFLEDMIIHHEGAVEMAKILQAGTKRPELQKMASDIITVQTAEIEMMKKWLEEWF